MMQLMMQQIRSQAKTSHRYPLRLMKILISDLYSLL